MTLIKSISGIRGTIGGKVGENLTPSDIVKFTYSFATFIRSNSSSGRNKIVIGRDARISGEMVSNIVSGTLISCGFDVIDLGLSTTPTVEMAVVMSESDGGIIITASHNPKNWNALKLLNNCGEFLTDEAGKEVIRISEEDEFVFSNIGDIGTYCFDDSFNDRHLDEILNLKYVNVDLVKQHKFKVVLDAVNSTGGFMVPRLLEKMGVNCVKLYCDPNGDFPHDPEPLPENLTDVSKLVVDEGADFGIVVDPDVDRLAFVCEDGSMFGEEYTLVAISDFILSVNSGNTVSNLSSTRALKDITDRYGGNYSYSSVGEVNVVEKMKKTNAIIGGEGNGGVILPELHYGRDALLGIALFLTFLAKKKISVKNLRDTYPQYYMSKNKIKLDHNIDLDSIFSFIENKYINEKISKIDGLKIDFTDGWVHLRASNTEPVIRIYAESLSLDQADSLANEIIKDINSLSK